MLYREIIAVCSQIRTEHIYTLCGQNVEFASVQAGGFLIVTTGLENSETAIFCDVFLLPVTWRYHASLCLPDCTSSHFRVLQSDTELCYIKISYCPPVTASR